MLSGVDNSSQLERHGYEILQDCISHQELERINAAVSDYDERGTRTLLRNSTVNDIAHTCIDRLPALNGLIPLLATYLPKSFDNNWFVSLHRDEVVPIQQYHPGQGWVLPTVKEGIPHAKPPKALLSQCIALRLQLTNTSEGALKLLPGSHEPSKKPSAEIVASVLPGGALLMRPSILHASSKLKTPGIVRRVLHILYGPVKPPEPFQWYSFDA